MIKVLIGPKGSGKTKTLLDMVNSAVTQEDGNVVCITKGLRHKFDIDYNVRLVDVDEFLINNVQMFYGLLCGIIAENYDVTHIFIDSMAKIITGDHSELDKMLVLIEKLHEKYKVKFTITISGEKHEAPEIVSKYSIS